MGSSDLVRSITVFNSGSQYTRKSNIPEQLNQVLSAAVSMLGNPMEQHTVYVPSTSQSNNMVIIGLLAYMHAEAQNMSMGTDWTPTVKPTDSLLHLIGRDDFILGMQSNNIAMHHLVFPEVYPYQFAQSIGAGYGIDNIPDFNEYDGVYINPFAHTATRLSEIPLETKNPSTLLKNFLRGIAYSLKVS